MVGEFEDRDKTLFIESMRRDLVRLVNARRFITQQIQEQTGADMVRVKMIFDILPIEPLAEPAKTVFAQASWCLFLDEYPDLHQDIQRLLDRVEEKERQIRASKAGIELVSSMRPPGS